MFFINLAEQRHPSSISAKPTYNESFVLYCHRSRKAIDFTQYSIRNCAHENHCGETSPAQPQYVAMSRSGGREVAKRDLWYAQMSNQSQQQYSAISRSRIGERCASYGKIALLCRESRTRNYRISWIHSHQSIAFCAHRYVCCVYLFGTTSILSAKPLLDRIIELCHYIMNICIIYILLTLTSCSWVQCVEVCLLKVYILVGITSNLLYTLRISVHCKTSQ